MFTNCKNCEAWEQTPVQGAVDVPLIGKCTRYPPLAALGQAPNLAGQLIPVVMTFRPETRESDGCSDGIAMLNG